MSFRTRLQRSLVLTSVATLLVSSLAAMPLVWIGERSAQHSYDLNELRNTAQMALVLNAREIQQAKDPAAWFANNYAQSNPTMTVQVVPMDADGTLHWNRAATGGTGATVPAECRKRLIPPTTKDQEDVSGFGISSCGRPENAVYQFTVPATGQRFYVASQLTETLAIRETVRIAEGLAVGALVVLALILALSHRLARRLQRPIADAAATAARITAGERGLELPERGNDELAALGRDFNRMTRSLIDSLDRVTRSEQRQRQFVSDVAHELRTPLATLLASSEALTRSEHRDEAAALVVPQIERLAQLTTDLLEIARLDEGNAALRLEEVDLDALVGQVIAASPLAAQTVQHGRAGTVQCDPVRIGVILRNLLVNAAAHGEPPVAVRLHNDQNNITVEVTDAGPGVPEPVRDHVFERFVQADNSRNTIGSGLGLSLARENAWLHGGDLDVDQTGRTFRLNFPNSQPLKQ